MKIVVLGATGGTGRHVVQQALDSGHEVTVFARDADKITVQHAHLKVAIGDVADRSALTNAIRGNDSVVSTLGRGRSFTSEHLIAHAVPNILAAMAATGTRRLVFTSAMGVGDSYQDAPLVPRLFFRTLLRGIYADKLIGDDLIRRSALDWTLVQPSQMHDGLLTKTYRSGERLEMTGMPRISRADAAHFIIRCLTDAGTIRKTVIVSE